MRIAKKKSKFRWIRKNNEEQTSNVRDIIIKWKIKIPKYNRKIKIPKSNRKIKIPKSNRQIAETEAKQKIFCH